MNNLSTIQAYKQQREQEILNMTPGEQLTLLYDETIKCLKKAEILAKNSDFDFFEKEVKHAQKIVTYLDTILDRKYTISMELTRLYDFFGFQMARLTAGRNLSIIGELIPLIEDLRDTYKKADTLSKLH
jgi:flagellar protein FliS